MAGILLLLLMIPALVLVLLVKVSPAITVTVYVLTAILLYYIVMDIAMMRLEKNLRQEMGNNIHYDLPWHFPHQAQRDSADLSGNDCAEKDSLRKYAVCGANTPREGDIYLR